ncbi:MAG TPA: DcrB-related protein [Planctomycetota bacterium]|nr:DcrB-related protein [Planctomycetota bacterium]
MRQFFHNDIIIGYPDEWRDGSIVILLGQPQGDYSPSITVTRDKLDGPKKPEEYAADQLPALKNEFGIMGYEVSNEGPAKLGDNPCFERFHTFTLPETGVKVKQWQVYLCTPKEAITITSSDKVENFEKSLPVFKEAVSQLKLLKT